MNSYQRPSGSLISYMSNQVKSYGGINLAQGIPGFQPPRELLRYLSETALEPVHQYAPGNGNEALLELLLEKYRAVHSFTKDNLLITNGATEAVSLLYTYFHYILQGSFSVMGFEPAYETYLKLPDIFRDRFIAFSYEQDGTIDFDRLRTVCDRQSVRIIFVNTPGNPYGRIWDQQEIEALVNISRELDIYLVLDSVYQELYFDREPYHPVSSFNDHMFYVNSFSKIFSITGWRIGYLMAPARHMEGIRSVHDYTGLSVPSVLQEALARYIKACNWGRSYIEGLRRQLSANFQLMKGGLEELGFYVPEIRGGFFVWARLPEGYVDGFHFAVDLYDQQKVAVIPGEHFSQRHPHYIRFNVAREKEEVQEGLKRIGLFFRSGSQPLKDSSRSG